MQLFSVQLKLRKIYESLKTFVTYLVPFLSFPASSLTCWPKSLSDHLRRLITLARITGAGVPSIYIKAHSHPEGKCFYVTLWIDSLELTKISHLTIGISKQFKAQTRDVTEIFIWDLDLINVLRLAEAEL